MAAVESGGIVVSEIYDGNKVHKSAGPINPMQRQLFGTSMDQQQLNEAGNIVPQNNNRLSMLCQNMPNIQ